MNKKSIFFDIDGTLPLRSLDTIRKHVAGAMKKGVVFGINTSRPFSEAEKIHKELNLNGPIIAEDGAEYRAAIGTRKITMPDVLPINEMVIRFLSRNGGMGSYVLKIAKDKRIIRAAKDPTIIVTPHRKFTSSIYIRRHSQESDYDIARVRRRISDFLKHEGARAYVKRCGKGKLIAGNATQNRISTLEYVAKRYLSSYDVLMVSDCEDAAAIGKSAIAFASVKNAEQRYAKKCALHAPYRGAKGIILLIDEFIHI